MYNYYYIPCDRIKKNRVGENGGLNQSKHQNSTIQVTRFFFIRSHVTNMDNASVKFGIHSIKLKLSN
jgi:hypothetical protein